MSVLTCGQRVVEVQGQCAVGHRGGAEIPLSSLLSLGHTAEVLDDFPGSQPRTL